MVQKKTDKKTTEKTTLTETFQPMKMTIAISSMAVVTLTLLALIVTL